MNILRRILGILVMIAGILGLVLSVAGLVGVWIAKPKAVAYLSSTVNTLNTSLATSQTAMDTTNQALGGAIDSIDALSVMLSSTAKSVADTGPVIDQVSTLMKENLPATLNSADDSLKSAQQAAVVLDSTVKSLEAFQTAMGDVPIISAFVVKPTQTYNPEKPLADSLGEVAANLDTLPAKFREISDGINKADNNLGTIQSSLSTMSDSVKTISKSLSDYQGMIGQSKASVDNLKQMLTNLQNNLASIVNGVSLGLTLFLVWLLVIQVVIITQGWELYQGTTDRMEGGKTETPAPQPAG